MRSAKGQSWTISEENLVKAGSSTEPTMSKQMIQSRNSLKKQRSQLDLDTGRRRDPLYRPPASGTHLDQSTISRNNLIYIRYRDHVLFKDGDASEYQPWIRETVGWLDYQDEEFVRIVWERFPEPSSPEKARLRSTGLAIDRRNILEMRCLV